MISASEWIFYSTQEHFELINFSNTVENSWLLLLSSISPKKWKFMKYWNKFCWEAKCLPKISVCRGFFLLEIYGTSIYYCFKEIFSYKVGLPIILNGTFFAFSKVTYEPKFNVIQFITNTWTNNSCINGLFAFWSTNRSFNPIHSIYCLLFGGGCLCMWCIAQFLIRLLTLLTSAKKPYYSMVGPTRRALCKPAIRTDW